MPDKNKLRAMRKAGYRIVESCGTCERGPSTLQQPRGWGGCFARKYHHLRHDREHVMPAHLAFVCGHYQQAQWVRESLGDYADDNLWVLTTGEGDDDGEVQGG